MSILEQIESDMASSLKGGDKQRLSTLRLLKSAIHNQQISSGQELADTEVTKVLAKEAKQRQDSITSYKDANRPELVASERAELEIIQSYLPEQLSDNELIELVEKALAATGANSMVDMGKVMAEVGKQAAGKADMNQVSQLVKARLASKE